MYESTDRLVTNEKGASKPGYKSVESRTEIPGNESNVPQASKNFYSKLRKAREENIGCCNFCMAFFALLLGSIVWTLVLIVIITVPFVMIVIGGRYVNECPVQKMIPISVIVAGCVAMLSNVINFVDRFRSFSESSMPKGHTVIGWINVFINLFLAAWFVTSCYYVYSADVQFDNANKWNYCNPHLFGFVYWLLNFIFIFFGTMVLVSSLLMCIALMCW